MVVKTWDFSVFLRLILRVIPMRQDEQMRPTRSLSLFWKRTMKLDLSIAILGGASHHTICAKV